MAQPAQIDDWIAPASAQGLDDWVAPPAAAPADDWVAPRREATLDAANVRPPTLRERIGGAIAGLGDGGHHSFWPTLARKLVGSSGLGHSEAGLLDVIPFTAPLFAPGDISQAQNPLEVVAATATAIPAPGVGPAAQGVRAIAKTAAEQQAAAGARQGVTATRAVDSGVADVVASVPTLVQNPVRSAAERELAELGAATERTLGRASRHFAPADAARRSLTDWLIGRSGSAQEAVAETTALRAAETGGARAAPSEAATREIVTPGGEMTITAQPELVELDQLQLAQGRFQPRDRARAEYQQEARERASRLDPARLQPERVADSGAPIVMQDGTILSGNGRALSIAEVYTNRALAERAELYRASLGPEAATMRQPVLVMRAGPMADDVAAEFARLANQSRVASMSATERAGKDAAALGSDGIALYQGGEFTAPQNAAFLRAFSERAVSAAERPAFSKGGELTQEGVNRMRAAVLHGAYEDAALLSRMLESTDDNIRNLTGGLTDAAPGMTALRADIRAGTVNAGMDAAKPVTDAVKLIADLRSRGVSPASHFAQADAFSQTDPVVEAWVRAFYNDELTRPVSRQKMAEVLDAYTTEARKHAPAGAGLFDDPTTAGDVLKVATRARGEDAAATAAQGNLGELAPGVGQGVRDGGAAPRGQSAPEVGGTTSAGGASVQGNAGAGAAGNASAGQAGKQALSAEASQRAITSNLVEARKNAVARAVGLPTQSATPEAISERLVEMARSRLPADVSGLMRVREIIGPEGWRDVSTGILHRLGAVQGGWDLQKFGQAWARMTKTGRHVLFGGKGMPRGFERALGDLATLSERIPRLRELTDGSILPGIVERLFRGRVTNVLASMLLHSFTGGATAGVQASAWAMAKFLSRPMVAPRVSSWAQAMAELAQHNTPRNSALARFMTQQLVDMEGGDDGNSR